MLFYFLTSFWISTWKLYIENVLWYFDTGSQYAIFKPLQMSSTFKVYHCFMIKHSVSFILDFLSVMHAKVIYICQHMGASYSQRWAVPLINLSFFLPSKDSPQPLIIFFHSQLCKSYLFGLLLTYCVTVNVIQIYQIRLLNGPSPDSASHHTIGSYSFL